MEMVILGIILAVAVGFTVRAIVRGIRSRGRAPSPGCAGCPFAARCGDTPDAPDDCGHAAASSGGGADAS